MRIYESPYRRSWGDLILLRNCAEDLLAAITVIVETIVVLCRGRVIDSIALLWTSSIRSTPAVPQLVVVGLL